MKKPARRTSKRRRPEAEEKRSGATRAMGAFLPALTSRALGRQGFTSATLISDWSSIIGDDLAECCRPVKLAFQRGKRNGGTLHLLVTSAAALEIQHLTPQIVERINSRLGYQAVAQLKLLHGRLPRQRKPDRPSPRIPAVASTPDPRHRARLDAVDDPALRASLERLGSAIAARDSEAKK